MKHTVGWREWVGLPELALDAVKAKVDTGARTSALHAADVRVARRGDRDWVRFRVPHDGIVDDVWCMAPLVGHRWVKDSGGKESLRPVIRTRVVLDELTWLIEVTLADRAPMGFPMLLGRQALRGRFVVDPEASFVGGRRRVQMVPAVRR